MSKMWKYAVAFIAGALFSICFTWTNPDKRIPPASEKNEVAFSPQAKTGYDLQRGVASVGSDIPAGKPEEGQIRKDLRGNSNQATEGLSPAQGKWLHNVSMTLIKADQDGRDRSDIAINGHRPIVNPVQIPGAEQVSEDNLESRKFLEMDARHKATRAKQ